jgi:ATP-dependent DNA helicase RecQ
MVLSCLKILQREGYLELTEELDNPSKVHFLVGRDELYKFQIANANYDGFIKLLLRSYSALFTNYVSIDEDLLAKRANISVDVIKRYLSLLGSNKIIHYIPRKKTPFIIFTRERIEPERLKISKENYTDRKADYQKRIDAMLHYSFGKLKCRSQILLEYFGEKTPVRCGKCDICMEQNKLGLSQLELEKISKQLEGFLQEPLLFEELIFKLDNQEDELIEVIRWLIDSGKIVHRVDNRLEWVKE